jgi:hypothetical protein
MRSSKKTAPIPSAGAQTKSPGKTPRLNGSAAAGKNVDDAPLQRMRAILQRDYLAAHPQAKIAVKRFSSCSIRIRIIDPTFQGVLLTERDAEVWKILEQLSDDDFRQIGMLVLVSPKEIDVSWANQEFEAGPASKI